MSTASTTATKTPAIAIAITRAEGPVRLCRTRTFKTWKNAAAALLAAAATYPASGGYDKHDLVVTFADGETYKGRLDCKAKLDARLAEEVRSAPFRAEHLKLV
jgi:hypothetical protein